MSPELLEPDKFGMKDGRSTKESDCYALGMVVYEVLSGRVPFPKCSTPVIIRKVMGGEHLGDRRGHEGYGLQTICGGCWNIAGNLTRTTARVLKR